MGAIGATGATGAVGATGPAGPTGPQGPAAPGSDVLAYFSRVGNDIFITGANLHVQSGAGSTDATPNGLGNLIIGYGEVSGHGRTGSHNLVLGMANGYDSYGAIVAGWGNYSNAPFASVLGGQVNIADGKFAVVLTGDSHQASGIESAIISGENNVTTGYNAVAVGGFENNVEANVGVIDGGWRNHIAKVDYSAGAAAAVIGGGYLVNVNPGGNLGPWTAGAFEVNGTAVTVAGANLQIMNGLGSTDATPNGLGNLIIGYNELSGHGRAGSHNLVLGMANGYDGYAGIVAGWGNYSGAPFASVLGGQVNIADGKFAVVLTGDTHQASGIESAIISGENSVTTGQNAVVVGGFQNNVEANAGVIDGGWRNHMAKVDYSAGAAAAVIGGGYLVNVSPGGNLGPWTAGAFEVNGTAVTVAGANLRVTNGTGQTNTANGTGNLIIGYAEPVDAVGQSSGSHNLVMGQQPSFSSYGAIVAGYGGTSSAPYASVLGGYKNFATGIHSAVVGGYNNNAAGDTSVVTGGASSTAGGPYTAISGGLGESMTTEFGWVGGSYHSP
jgi:hypothetical protein